ncbi:hypothetical protein GS911_11370 [Rhodococcus hoagii]|nr:hypothetical protein [Prescottella equi]
MKARRKAAHARRVTSTYGIGFNAYTAILEAQNGRCYICQRATGATRRLAVDHDHTCCPAGGSCGRCVRGLLCSPCIGFSATSGTTLTRSAGHHLPTGQARAGRPQLPRHQGPPMTDCKHCGSRSINRFCTGCTRTPGTASVTSRLPSGHGPDRTPTPPRRTTNEHVQR